MIVVFAIFFWAALAGGLLYSRKSAVFWPLLALALLLLFNQFFIMLSATKHLE